MQDTAKSLISMIGSVEQTKCDRFPDACLQLQTCTFVGVSMNIESLCTISMQTTVKCLISMIGSVEQTKFVRFPDACIQLQTCTFVVVSMKIASLRTISMQNTVKSLISFNACMDASKTCLESVNDCPGERESGFSSNNLKSHIFNQEVHPKRPV